MTTIVEDPIPYESTPAPQPPPPTPPPRTTTKDDSSSNKIKIAEPSDYNGDRKKFKAFLRQTKIWIAARKITDSDDKILTVLSYMKHGDAEQWAQQYVDRHFEDDVPEFPAFYVFLNDLTARFKDKVSHATARERLEVYKQNNLLVDQHIQNLDAMFLEAKLRDNTEKIRILEKSTDKEIIKMIYSNPIGVIPEIYSEYCAGVLQIGRLQEKYRHQEALERSSHRQPQASTSRHPQTTPHVTPQHPPRQATTGERKTGTGITFGGHGKPMDIDRTKVGCFNCGKKDHWRKDCPDLDKQRMNVRSLVAQMTDEERNELLSMMVIEEESDFVDGR